MTQNESYLMTEITMHPAINATLGLPSSEELKAFRSEARDLVTALVLDGPGERLDAVTKALSGYVGQSHPAARADVLKDALDAYGDVVAPADWTRVHKAFKEALDRKAKAGRRSAYQAGMTRVAEFSELVWVETVAEDCLHGRFIHSSGFGWMKYTGVVWKPVTTETVMDLVRDFTARKAIDILEADTHDPREINKMLKSQFVFNVTRLCQGYELISVESGQMDADPDLLNCLNGTVDLRTGELRPHSPADYFTKCAPTEYVPGATDPAWDQALSSMEPEVADWMQLRYGNGVTGHVADDHRMCFLNGTGGNGKSMHLDGISHTIGSGKTGYLAMLSDNALVAQNPDKEAVMSFRGARLAVMEELPAGRQLNVAALKRYVGTREMTGRHLYKSEMTWAASHSLFVTSNYELSVNETDDGTWRRLVKCPFPYSYKDAHEISAPHERLKDYTLSGRLASPSARRACLAWLVEGAKRWYVEGLGRTALPAAVQRATEGWRNEADMVFRFFNEHLIAEPGHHIAASDMLKAFNQVMSDESQAAWSQKTFSSRAKDHTTFKKAGVETARVSGGTGKHPVASRRHSATYGMDSLPSRYMAFTGVRFRTEADDADELVEPDPIPATEGVQAPATGAATGVCAPVVTPGLFAAEAPAVAPSLADLVEASKLALIMPEAHTDDPWNAAQAEAQYHQYLSDADWDESYE